MSIAASAQPFMMADTATPNEDKRAALRRTISSAVSGLVKTLEPKPKDSYASDELTALGISLTPFDPGDPSFFQSKGCLFNPIPWEDSRLFLQEPNFLIGILESYHESGQDFIDLDDLPFTSSSHQRAGQILWHVGKLYRKFFKDNCWGLVNLWGSYSWD